MTTHFITAEIDLQENPLTLKENIEKHLNQEGKPLRWAITAVDKQENKAKVEAIITK